jgi:hypothetical protein
LDGCELCVNATVRPAVVPFEPPAAKPRGLPVLSHAAADNQFLRSRLPAPAFEKLISLTAKNDLISASYNSVFSDLAGIRDRSRRAAARLGELERLPPLHPTFSGREQNLTFQYLPPGEGRDKAAAQLRDRVIGAAREEATRAAEQLQRLEAEAAALSGRMSAIPQKIVTWLKTAVPENVAIAIHDGKVQPPKGEPLDVVGKLRQKLQLLENERGEVAAAPYPKAVTHQVIRQFVQQLSARGQPDLRPVIAEARAPALPMTTIHLTGEMFRTTDTAALLAWFDPDQLYKVMLARLNELHDADARDGLDDSARRRRTAELGAQCLQIEREIEATIVAAEVRGIEIKRSDNANPIAVLSLHSELNQWRA